MPRTKLSKYSISKAEVDARIIKSVMARDGVFTARALSDKIHADPGHLSKGFKNGFSDSMKMRIIHALSFTTEEKEALLRW
jgi:hypothetical protein